ncbi:M14 family metallopeptidase [Paraferrimonas sedimenticola]|uniref:Peptidase M14 n=1 Tax=Paraferrimonas sedimenticola TaxID=375674 RepID=A0AA37RYK6_9GAMM|nr:M14 family metallopeptidase [Paraferrimonas sedimenticola]GLP96982.1 peptidase M14 [Paraferrimonas sedimenticola]
MPLSLPLGALKRTSALALALALSHTTASASALDSLQTPSPYPLMEYSQPLLTGDYSNAITHPDKVLGFEVGSRVVHPDQVTELLKIWAQESDRIQLVEYARTHEGRPLHVAYISNSNHLSKLDEYKADIAKLAMPKGVNSSEIESIINKLPATAWMAYTIHGNETSGVDSAVAALYHLLADQSAETQALLDNMVVMIDPLMNPDGLARFNRSLQRYRGASPNVDDQSLLHRGDWPAGRTNHYYFDLNRDFFYLTQPETRGRVALINQWYPQLMIDAHEQGSQDTYLMGPPRDPLNFNIAPSVQKWGKVFSLDQGAAYDKRQWRYYTGEWFENWYPGYSNYAQYRGSVHILYEQARIAEDGVARTDGTIRSYKESVHHQYVSTFANLETLAKHSKEMYRDFVKDRQSLMGSSSPIEEKTFAILPQGNITLENQFLQKLQAQGIQVYRMDESKRVRAMKDQTGQMRSGIELPKGTLLVPTRQPEARLISAILEFDAEVKEQVLIEERKRVLKGQNSLMYDTTAWNMTMMYGMPAYEIPKITMDDYPLAELTTAEIDVADGIAWVVDGKSDGALAFAAKLMERGLEVRASNITSKFNGIDLAPGSVMVTGVDNPGRDVQALIKAAATEANVNVSPISSGYGEGDLPEWGGSHFPLLERPRIAILSGPGTSAYDVGATWFAIDSALGIRHSKLDLSSINRADLRRYNTIVVPTAWGKVLSKDQLSVLEGWVKAGGTLITQGRASQALAGAEWTDATTLDKVFEKPEKYDTAVYREWLAQYTKPNLEAVLSYAIEPTPLWDREVKYADKDALKHKDSIQSRFMPSGAFVNGRIDPDHWLGFGLPSTVPLLIKKQPVLTASAKADNVARIGVMEAKDPAKAIAGEWEVKGWTSVPKDAKTLVRASGLLWPEARERLLNSSYLIREQVGKGQVILFSGEPNFRGATLGTRRMFLNALVYGPGMGTRLTVPL